jgi:hypothetical protein
MESMYKEMVITIWGNILAEYYEINRNMLQLL